MKILSIYWDICSSVSLFIDNKVVGAVSEERFSREKNDSKFPIESIKWILENNNLTSKDLDYVAIGSNTCGVDYIALDKNSWSVEDYLKEQKECWHPKLIDKQDIDLIFDVFPEKINTKQYPKEYWEQAVKTKDLSTFNRDRKNIIANFLDIDSSKVHFIEHHRCHSAYSYYTSSFRDEKVLSFTIDAEGDGLNATIGIIDEQGKYKRVYKSDQFFVGRIYRYMTLLLGMKPNEHEYKVMGLAPYGREKYAKKALDVFSSTLYVDGIEFKWKTKPTDSYFWFKERLEGIRFDNLAWALQQWVENLLTEWIDNAIKKFGISTIILSGGVAMNIKAIGSVAKLDSVKKIFVGGSSSDESMSISAGICLAEDKWDGFNHKECYVKSLYLGPEQSFKDEKKVIESLNHELYEIKSSPTASDIAKFLIDGKVIARSAGKMEFGQRALGNRSILADPSNLLVKERINRMIKNRDFWMPFAPVMLDSYAPKYLDNPKTLHSPYMTIGFDTTNEGFDSMIAASHPADKSVRAQILTKDHNCELYSIITEFEKETGRGAILNTSFNLHGFPIVNTPEDAIYVFENSGLEVLVLNHFAIIKKEG